MQNQSTKFKIVFFSLVILAFFGVSEECWGATFHVGSDEAYPTISACSSVAQTGDTCLVHSGTYGSPTLPRDGSLGSPITFKAATGEFPVVTGTWNLEGRHHIVIDGFEISGGGFSSSPYSGAICGNIEISNNHITGASLGINLKGNDILISGNTFNDMSNDMIRQFGERWVIRNNTVINETEPTDVHMDFWQSFCSGTTTGVAAQRSLIENNTVVGVSGGNVHFALVNGTLSCNYPPVGLIFRYNKIHDIGSMGIYIDNNQQASGATDNVVYNNTFSYLSGGSFTWEDAGCFLDASANSSGINNLFHTAMKTSSARGFYFSSGGYQSNNLYYSDSGSMTFSAAASGEEGAVKNQKPLLVDPSNNDFSLLRGSSAIDAGGSLANVSATDVGSGVSLFVNKADFFQDGSWASGIEADWVAVGSFSNVAQISSINYDTNMLVLTNSVSRNIGDPVWLYKDSDGTEVLHGNAPDIGAYEYVEGGSDTTPPQSPGGLSVR